MFNKISALFSSNQPSTASEDSKEVVVFSPLDGGTLSLEQVPDPVFAQKMLGDGMAIEPTSRTVLAPFTGEVVAAFSTQHAIGLRSEAGLECLIHVGIDTVALNGQGFHLLVEQGQKVKQGDPLIELELDVLRSSGKALSTPVVITNGDCWQIRKRSEEQTISAGNGILYIAQPVD